MDGGERQAPDAPRWARGIEHLVDLLGRAVSWLGLFMVLATSAVVVLRYVLGMGSVALQESVAYMHATLFLVGASYALVHDGHVRVDVLYRGWSARTKALVDLFGTLLLLFPFCGFTVLISLRYVGASWAMQEGSPEAGGLPGVFLLKSLIPLSAGLLAIAGVARLARAVATLRAPRDATR